MSKMSLQQFSKKIDNWKNKHPEQLRLAMTRAAQLVVRQSQSRYLAGPRPNKLEQVTGRLWRSIKERIRMTGTRITAQIGTNVSYAAIHESDTPTTIVPIRAKALFIPISRTAKLHGYQKGMKYGVDFAMAKKVTIKPRPFLRPAVEDMRPRVLQMISEAMLRGYDHG